MSLFLKVATFGRVDQHSAGAEAGYLPAPPPLRASDCGHATAVETVHCDALAYTRRVRPENVEPQLVTHTKREQQQKQQKATAMTPGALRCVDGWMAMDGGRGGWVGGPGAGRGHPGGAREFEYRVGGLGLGGRGWETCVVCAGARYVTTTPSKRSEQHTQTQGTSYR
eukprot:scaffold10972_cov127-Isochrysis_galbana.AAC.10